MKAYWGSGRIDSRILDLGTRWRWVTSFTAQPLYPPGKNPWYPLDRRLGGSQDRSGRGGEEKISQSIAGHELPIVQPAHYTTELSRLLLSSRFLQKKIRWLKICRILFYILMGVERGLSSQGSDFWSVGRTPPSEERR